MTEKEIMKSIIVTESQQIILTPEELQAVKNILNNLREFNINSSIRVLRFCMNSIWLSLLKGIEREDKS